MGDMHAIPQAPPTSRARTPLSAGRESKGGQTGRLCHGEILPTWQGSNLEGLKTGKMAVEHAATSQPLKALGLAKRGGHKLLTNHPRTPSGAVRSLSEAAYCHQPREDQLHPCQPDQLLQPVDHGHDEPEDDDEAACGYGALRPPLLPFPAGW